MLSLLSHEPNFTIIREEVKYRREEVDGLARTEFIQTSNFQMMYINVLREYIELEFREATKGILQEFEFDVDRVIDDIIFLCFFVGNDFLPSLSVLDIGEGSIDMIFDIYKEKVLPEIKDYITEDGVINWTHAECIIREFSTFELSVLKKRFEDIMDMQKKAMDLKMTLGDDNNQSKYLKLRNKQDTEKLKNQQDLISRLTQYNASGYYKWCIENNKAHEKRNLIDQIKKQRDLEQKI